MPMRNIEPDKGENGFGWLEIGFLAKRVDPGFEAGEQGVEKHGVPIGGF